MKRAKISTLQALAPSKKPGYLEAYAQCGRKIRGGQWYEIADDDHMRIGVQYATAAAPAASKPPSIDRRSYGLGDAIASLATPIARAMKLDCIDPATRDLRPESGCFRRKQALNKIKL